MAKAKPTRIPLLKPTNMVRQASRPKKAGKSRGMPLFGGVGVNFGGLEAPSEEDLRVTQDGDTRITSDGDIRIPA